MPNTTPLTASTITDEQIRYLRDHAWDFVTDPVKLDAIHVACGWALAKFRHTDGVAARAAARARCAEILVAIGPTYQPKVGAALAAVDGWTVQDFIDLAIAAADQAGASALEQAEIAEILNARAKEQR